MAKLIAAKEVEQVIRRRGAQSNREKCERRATRRTALLSVLVSPDL